MSRTSRERYSALRQSAWRHPKIRSVSKGARLLFVMGLSYIADFETDGRIPVSALPVLDGTKREAGELVSAGLWSTDGSDYVVKSFLDHNASHSELEAIRATRRAAGAKGGRSKALASATANSLASATAVARPEPERRASKPLPESESDGESESDLSPGGESTPAPATPPEPRVRRRDVHDFAGAPADAAQAALSAACVAAGGTPKPRGGYPTQQAWAQVACDAAELAEKLSLPVADVLALSARGFVAARGVQGNPVWWSERFGDYLEAGRKPAARKAGQMHPLPPVESYKPTTDAELDAMFGPETAA